MTQIVNVILFTKNGFVLTSVQNLEYESLSTDIINTIPRLASELLISQKSKLVQTDFKDLKTIAVAKGPLAAAVIYRHKLSSTFIKRVYCRVHLALSYLLIQNIERMDELIEEIDSFFAAKERATSANKFAQGDVDVVANFQTKIPLVAFENLIKMTVFCNFPLPSTKYAYISTPFLERGRPDVVAQFDFVVSKVILKDIEESNGKRTVQCIAPNQVFVPLTDGDFDFRCGIVAEDEQNARETLAMMANIFVWTRREWMQK